ncbi:MAG: STAS domain-containing protein [Candidatus Sumerlaeota bacterium]|nr:STAS domain-containing protein [Candidatus Sumerlaeota bacterium]
MEEILTERKGASVVIRLSGVLDRRLSTLMREEMARASLMDGTQRILINLADIQRMDSMGIGMLVSAFRSCQSRSVDFAIIGVTERSSEVLRITGLDKVLPITTLEDEAQDEAQKDSSEQPPQP